MKTPGFRHIALALAASSLIASGAVADDKVVVELFTSQGCSSCPPADALMGEFSVRDDIIVLSLPVDYWDFLGWKDTLADPAYSERQRSYARYRGDSEVYTPQTVIGGIEHAVGSRRDDIEQKIAAARGALAEHQVDIAIVQNGDTITITIDGEPSAKAADATVWLVLYRAAIEVRIGRGENVGRTVTYYNVVREMTPIGMWHGTTASFELPRNELMRGGSDGCAVLVQARDTGPILAAARLASW
jgi:hypothetical protein